MTLIPSFIANLKPLLVAPNSCPGIAGSSETWSRTFAASIPQLPCPTGTSLWTMRPQQPAQSSPPACLAPLAIPTMGSASKTGPFRSTD
ncbi:hypothetical protein DSO57_1001937 [Entomophthora muscae]|uniref:Uncharacterized protein n=1 Tax=Entomophthora muscae TaxID=34485 RepID=A0ACC2UUS6_9FUNG|nr:hypothetical protein DSO57_1001937 [Entomophthora muscae]